ncbi:type IV secretory system conjugative DNA transfer family protein [Phenylobacterium sp.]|uniref:type IV secretory system conjugative DNA transfer family protein n=1 Tax=Phenylobacterium sp. TaxID=1871053 RepID=UPI0025FC4034|nr:type IV secretory system conjugative DNA transfer family protein [Phenylobacterium sp.]
MDVDRAQLGKVVAGGLAALLGLGMMAYVTIVIALAGMGALNAETNLWRAAQALWTHRSVPEIARWLKLGATSSLVLFGGFALAVFKSRRRPRYGDARWARRSEIAQAGLFASEGLVLGRHGQRPLIFGGDEHVLLAAPTRSGKGVGLVIPNLLSWPGSVVVLDLKRENWGASAGYRQACGQTCILFDPLSPEGRTARFNPLGHIDRADPAVIIDELQRIAVMLFVAGEHADLFWSEAARTGFIAVGAYVAETPELGFDLGEIYRQLTAGDPRSRLREIIKAREAAGRPLSSPCQSALSDFCSASDNTFASVRQTITSRMGLWLNPRVCAATSASDFDFRSLRRKPTSLYLAASPEDVPRLAPLMSLLFQQLIDQLTRAGPAGPNDPLPVLLLLDEFAQLGPAKALAKAFSYIAGYGVRLMPVLQSPAQLRAIYGHDGAQEIIDNCGVEVVFAPKDLDVARALSLRLGDFDIKSESRSRPLGLAQGRRSLSQSVAQRALMLPDELMRMPQSDLIVLRAGARPVRGRKIIYWKEPVFAERVRPPPDVAPLPASAPPPPAADAAPSLAPQPQPFERERASERSRFSKPPEPSTPPPPSTASDDERLGWTFGQFGEPPPSGR